MAREQGTERAFNGTYCDHHEEGRYECVCCGLPLFASEDKFESGSGWPSFTQPLDEANLAKHADRKYGMLRCCARSALRPV